MHGEDPVIDASWISNQYLLCLHPPTCGNNVPGDSSYGIIFFGSVAIVCLSKKLSCQAGASEVHP